MGISDYYTLGRTGLRVSRLALGTMTFGDNISWGADRAASRHMFDLYLDAGGNFIDTADVYTAGRSEEWLGEFIRESGTRDRVVLATKFSHSGEPGNPNAAGNGRKNILRAVEASLRRLGTDYLDLYILHTWDRVTPAEEVMRTLDDLVTSGKVRHVGLSDTPAWYAARAQTIAECCRYERACVMQMEYSLIERRIEWEFTPLADECGMGIMVWGGLSGGMLSGKYRPSESGGTGTGRLGNNGMWGSSGSKFTERNWKIVAELEQVAKEVGRSQAQVALNWVAHRPCVASVVLGATRPEQLQDNLAALDFELPAALVERLEAVSRPEPHFPYTFHTPAFQARLHGGASVAAKPTGYWPEVAVDAKLTQRK